MAPSDVEGEAWNEGQGLRHYRVLYAEMSGGRYSGAGIRAPLYPDVGSKAAAALTAPVVPMRRLILRHGPD